MINAIKTWFEKNSWITHVYASACFLVTLTYATNPTFRDYANTTAMTIYRHLPAWLAQFVVGAVIPMYLIYRQQLSQRGKKMVALEALKEAPQDPQLKKAAKLPVAALICLALGSSALIGTTGCNSMDAQKAAQLISGVLPSVLSAEQAVGALLVAVDPAVGIPLQAFQPLISAGVAELENLLRGYEANPSASAWASVVSTVDNLVNQGDQQLLAASQIKDVASQAKATGIIAAFDALLHVIDGYVQQTQSVAQVKKTMTARKVSMNKALSLLNQQQRGQVAQAYGFAPAQFTEVLVKGY